MERIEVLKHISEIVRSSLMRQDIIITDTSAVEEIEGWGSLENAMIITALEQDYKIKFKLSELLSWHTIGELADLIIAKVESN